MKGDSKSVTVIARNTPIASGAGKNGQVVLNGVEEGVKIDAKDKQVVSSTQIFTDKTVDTLLGCCTDYK